MRKPVNRIVVESSATRPGRNGYLDVSLAQDGHPSMASSERLTSRSYNLSNVSKMAFGLMSR